MTLEEKKKDWREFFRWQKDWESKELKVNPMAEINVDTMNKGRLYLNVYFPESRLCVYEEHLPYIKESIEKFEELLKSAPYKLSNSKGKK